MRQLLMLLVMALFIVGTVRAETEEPPRQEVAAVDGDAKATKETKGNSKKEEKKKEKELVQVAGNRKGPFTFKLDGKGDEWKKVQALFPEPGGKVDDPGFSVDIIKVYMTNDDDYCYFLMRCVPTVQERFKNNGIGGGFGDLYFDLDNNRDSGSTDTDVGAFGYGNGYELKAFVEIGVLDLHGPKEAPYIMHTLKKLHISGDMGSKLISDMSMVPEALLKKREYKWKKVQGGAQFSYKKGTRITFGDDGVEFKIPRKFFGLKRGETMRVMLAEDAHEFKPEGYSVASFTMK